MIQIIKTKKTAIKRKILLEAWSRYSTINLCI